MFLTIYNLLILEFMSSFNEISPIQGQLLETIEEKYQESMVKLLPPIKSENLDRVESTYTHRSSLSVYANWYLYNLCCQSKFLKILVIYNREEKFYLSDDTFLSTSNKEGKKDNPKYDLEKDIYFLEHKKAGIDWNLQIKVAIPVAMKSEIDIIWGNEIIPFVENHLVFEKEEVFKNKFRDGKKRALDYRSYLEHELRVKIKEVIETGEIARVFHVRVMNLNNILKIMSIYDSHHLFDRVYNVLAEPSISSVWTLAFGHNSYFLVQSLSDLDTNDTECFLANNLHEIENKFRIKIEVAKYDFHTELDADELSSLIA